MKNKVLLVGASGTIGSAILQDIQQDHEVLTAGFSSGDYQVDLSSSSSIADLYNAVGEVNAVICAAARGVMFAPVETLTRENIVTSMQSKLLGQMDLVIQGLSAMPGDTCFILTTGILNADPIAKGSVAAMVNHAVEGFVRAAALDVPARQRINVVSPALVTESIGHYGDFFPGYDSVAVKDVAKAYRKSLMGRQTGQVFKVGWT